jgi:hypothetical protein
MPHAEVAVNAFLACPCLPFWRSARGRFGLRPCHLRETGTATKFCSPPAGFRSLKRGDITLKRYSPLSVA